MPLTTSSADALSAGQMALIRAFELRAAEMYTRAKIGGYCHLNLGEEATVVGLMAALRPEDYLFTTYREHGYALARGAAPGRVMAELFGRTDGLSRGRGGSMHLFDPQIRLLGGYGIVGGQLPPATGAALALAYRGEPGPDSPAVLCLLGDATTNIGAFHESLNLAALWRLPIVYVIINNQLGMGTPVEAASAEPELYKRGAPTGSPANGSTVTTCSRSATPPAPHWSEPAASTSRCCWRPSATGCAATRWSTLQNTGQQKMPNECAEKTRCPRSAPASWPPVSSTRRPRRRPKPKRTRR